MKNKNNQPAPLCCTFSIQIDAAPDKVWTILTDIDHWPSWNEKITRAKLSAGGLAPGVAFDWKVNGMPIRSVLKVVEDRKSLSWVGKTLGASAEHSWYLEVDKNGTLQMNKDLQTDMQRWLAALKKESERLVF